MKKKKIKIDKEKETMASVITALRKQNEDMRKDLRLGTKKKPIARRRKLERPSPCCWKLEGGDWKTVSMEGAERAMEIENQLRAELKALDEAFTQYRESVGVTGEAKSEYEQRILRLECENGDLKDKLRTASATNRVPDVEPLKLEILKLTSDLAATERAIKMEHANSQSYQLQIEVYKEMYDRFLDKLVRR